MSHSFEDIRQLSFWMVERIAGNKTIAIDSQSGCDWNWVASEVWNYYPGIVNEFFINDAIDLILEAAEDAQ